MKNMAQPTKTEMTMSAIVEALRVAARARAEIVNRAFVYDVVDELLENVDGFKRSSCVSIAGLTMRALKDRGYLLKYKSRGLDREVRLDTSKITSNSLETIVQDVKDFERTNRINAYRVRKKKKEKSKKKSKTVAQATEVIQPELGLQQPITLQELHARLVGLSKEAVELTRQVAILMEG